MPISLLLLPAAATPVATSLSATRLAPAKSEMSRSSVAGVSEHATQAQHGDVKKILAVAASTRARDQWCIQAGKEKSGGTRRDSSGDLGIKQPAEEVAAAAVAAAVAGGMALRQASRLLTLCEDGVCDGTHIG